MADTEPTSEPRDPAVFGATILLHDSGSTDNYSSNSLCRPDRGSGKKPTRLPVSNNWAEQLAKGRSAELRFDSKGLFSEIIFLIRTTL